MGKILEKLILRQLLTILEPLNVLAMHQFEFRHQHPTIQMSSITLHPPMSGSSIALCIQGRS